MIPLSDQTLRLSEKVAQLTLGLDALYRAESPNEEIDGLVVVNMGNTAAEPLRDYADGRMRIAQLAAEALTLPEADRRLYYAQTCVSLDSFCAYRQGKLTALSDQVDLFLHVNPAPVSDAQLDAYRSRLRELLSSMGYNGDLKKQCAEWEAKNIVPADEVQGTVDGMIELAMEKTGRILELPVNDFYHCATERGVPYNARSDYDNRQVVINIDPVLTRQGLKHLVCHECYPGHFMQFSLRRMMYERGVGGADGLLSVVNHSSSSTFEGIADVGIEFIDWVEDDDDRVCMLLNTLKSALGTGSSYRLHALDQSDSEVEAYLRQNALVGGEGWIANRLGFIRNQARAALIWSYWRGDQGVEGVWNRIDREDRAKFYDYIYGRLHTVQSMELFR